MADHLKHFVLCVNTLIERADSSILLIYLPYCILFPNASYAHFEKVFFKNILEDITLFRVATDIPVLD